MGRHYTHDLFIISGLISLSYNQHEFGLFTFLGALNHQSDWSLCF